MIFTNEIIETENAFMCNGIDLNLIDFGKLRLLVKAHEKEIYEYGDKMIIARIHNDNHGAYPFSKLDFLSHKLQEIVYPENVPKLYAASFKDKENIFFVLERIEIDVLHKAYNIYRQRAHKSKGESYEFDNTFLDTKDELIEEYSKIHFGKVEKIQRDFSNNLEMYGITFDHSQVNIAWKDDTPIALEVHKCQREYLFNYERCREYFLRSERNHEEKSKAIQILDRIEELYDIVPKDTSK